MSLIAGAIEHVKFRSDLVAAFDFSQLDGTLTATSLYGSGGQTITFSGVQQVSSDGVLLDGTQTAALNEEVPRTTLHLLYLIKPSVPDFKLLNKTDGWDFKLYATGGVPAMNYQSSYDGKRYDVAHPNALELDKLTLLSFMNAYSGSKQIVGIGDMGALTISNETQANRYYGQPIHAGTLLFEDFAGSCAGLLIFNAEVSDADIIEIMGEVGIYGNISLPTNLNLDRFLSGTVLKADRTVDGNFTVAADSQTLEGYSESKVGELLEFVAFDSDEAGSIYKSAPVDPSLATSLEFQAIFGGSSGAPSQTSKVSGVVQIDGTPAQRTVRAFGYDPTAHRLDGENINLSKSLGHATSDPNTGEYTIDLLGGYDKQIFVVAFDDYGADFAPDLAMAVGDRVHPTTPNGYVWECTSAGVLPSEEPVWVVDTETSQLYGTASMIARPFYRPMVHGPVAPDVTATTQWTPANLFSSNETGAWYDPSDLTTLYQDAAGTQPVVNDGDPVALMMDKSGNGKHAAQSSSSRRPIYRTNGTDHWLETNTSGQWLEIPRLLTNPWSAIFCAHALDLTKNNTILSQSEYPGETRTIIYLERSTNPGGMLQVGGTTITPADQNIGNAITYSWVRNGSIGSLYRDGTLIKSENSLPAGDSQDQPTYLLSTPSFFSPIRFYGAVFVDGAELAAADREKAENYLMAKVS